MVMRLARTIGTPLRGELNQEFADLREMDRDIDRELERDERESGSRRDSRPEPYLRIRGERVPNPAFIAMFPDAARDTFGFDVPTSMVALEEIVNDDSIVLTPEMVEVINDPQMRMTRNGEITTRTGRDFIRRSGQFSRANILPPLPVNQVKPKRRRKASKYQKELGKQLKLLKKKHPRTPVIRLMKRAHRATKKALK